MSSGIYCFSGRVKQSMLALALVGVLASCDSAGRRQDPVRSEPGAAWNGPSPSRLVLLVATCSLNRRYLAPYEPAVTYTPRFRAFAAEGVVFENHYTETGQSGPSFASIFGGVQADRHGVYRHPTRLSDELYLIGEAFSDHGYESFFWDKHPMSRAGLNYAQGIPWENVVRGKLTGGDPRFRGVLEKLREDPSYKAFVLTNFAVTHSPYAVSDIHAFRREFPAEDPGLTGEEIDRYYRLYLDHRSGLQWSFPETTAELGLTQAEVDRLAAVIELHYKAAVARLDRLFGGIVSAVRKAGLLEESLIVFTADHGETMYSPSALFPWAHGLELSNDVLSVPWIVRLPGPAPRGGRYRQVTRSIDVYPTILGLAGIELADDLAPAGVDLSPALRRDEPPPHLVAYFHTTVMLERILEDMRSRRLAYSLYPRVDPELMWVGSREGNWLFELRNLDGERWGFQAFDLARDPGETADRFDPSDPLHRTAVRRLQAYKRLLVDRYDRYVHTKAKELRPPLEAEDVHGLKALGYIR